MIRRRIAVVWTAVVLTAGCTPYGADTLRAVQSSSPARPPTRTVTLDRTAWWGGDSYRLTALTTTLQPDGRTSVELVLSVGIESPVPVAAALPRATLESDGVTVSGPLEMTPPPYGRASLTATVQDVGTAGQQLDPDRLALVLTAPGAARAVIPVGARAGQDQVDLAPTPLRPSADGVRTGRHRLALASARLREDCSGGTGSAPTVLLGTVPVAPRVLSAPKPGRHAVEVLFEAPAGSTADGLLLHLTLPDGRRLAPAVPVDATPYPDLTGRISLAAWFDFYGDTTGTYTLEAVDRETGADPAVITLGTG
ncbi:hypothetical protein [Kitasatospora sp. NPDC004272]